MSGKTTIICKRDGKEIARYYEKPVGTTGSPPSLSSRDDIVKRAKESLSNAGLAGPPFEGIEFDIQYS
jgi:hypothetical protein